MCKVINSIFIDDRVVQSSFLDVKGISILVSAFSVAMVYVAVLTNGIEAQNNTNGSSLANMTNTSASNTSSILTNPTGSNPPGMSQDQNGPNPTRSNIPCVAGNSCM